MDLMHELDSAVPLQGLLGYLNFSQGKPDPRVAKLFSEAYRFLGGRQAARPWEALHQALAAKLTALKAGGAAAFRESEQAEAALALLFDHLLTAYRQFHADLLFHLRDEDLFQPFFLARAAEAILAQGPPWGEHERVARGALHQLNDYVGHRPVAILETRPRGEPYPHERVRPVPLYLQGAGVACGRYEALLTAAFDILAQADPSLLAEASFDPAALEEYAFDPRAYDHGHPVGGRPNYLFGEWDPHRIDNRGRYRRYVARQVTLEAILDRVAHPDGRDPGELLFEAAAVLAGTTLMACGTSGSGPEAHDSTVTLTTLVARIARYRDTFYNHLIQKVSGPHGERLRQEAKATRQPFGAARQHLNQYLARNRAAQLQQRHVALLFAQMGYPEAARREAARIPAASVRLLTEMHGRIGTGQLLLARGELARAAALLPEVEDLLHRGIACGALLDPWNVLGFQGLYPLFTAREDSRRDGRVDDLTGVVEQLFDLYARLLSEAAAAGEAALVGQLTPPLRGLAAWWDQFATTEVGDVQHVHGERSADSAVEVAAALGHWRRRGEATADLAFWREHLGHFRSPKAFALVVDALLQKDDLKASMALLMSWLGQAGEVPLEEGEYSFHGQVLRWLLGVTAAEPVDWPLVAKFFDYLEANAESYWDVPALAGRPEAAAAGDEDEGDLFEAAYEGVTFKDSADDDQEGSVVDDGPAQEPFDLEAEADELTGRLKFLVTVARLWQLAAHAAGPARADNLAAWLAAALRNRHQLLDFLDAVQAHPIPEPLGAQDAIVEYERRRALKEQLLHRAIDTCLDTAMAVGALRGALGPGAAPGGEDAPSWEPLALRLERDLLGEDAAGLRPALAAFLDEFRQEPLLYVDLSRGGQPRQILRVRLAQGILKALAENLPRLGLLRETLHLLQTARDMERERPAKGGGISDFNHLFQAGFQSVVEAVAEATHFDGPTPVGDADLVATLERLAKPFLTLWVEHSRTLQLSVVEGVGNDAAWEALAEFIRRYGRDLFHQKFMVQANLRGLLHRGMAAFLDDLAERADPLRPVKLLDELGDHVDRKDAERHLQTCLQIVVENYEEYKDYNSTTTQSDYGENLRLFLDFLRLKAQYERQAWQLRPLVGVHDVLAQFGRWGAAVRWQQTFARMTAAVADRLLEELTKLEQKHGMRLRTVRDRLEERFVKPLAADRIRALVEPAMDEAQAGEAPEAFPRLERELLPFVQNPTGVGLDVPQWLTRLEEEVQEVRGSHTALAEMAQTLFRVPENRLTVEDIQRQLGEWE